MGCWMTERERTQDALLVEMADGLCKLLNPKHPTSAENFADGIANATEAFRAASAKQDDEDRNGVRRVMGKKDCTDLPIPEDDCQACKGTGMRGPDRICGACEGTGIAGEAKAAVPDRITHCEEPNTSCGTCKVRPRCDVSGRKQD